MNKSRIFPNAALLCIALVCLSSQGFSQRFEAPDGATIVGRRIFFERKVMWRNTWTRKCAYTSYYGPDLNHPELKEWHVTSGVYCAPEDLTIVDNLNVEKGSASYNIYVLSDGSVRGPGNDIYGTIDLSANESPAKVFGDALYVVTSQNIFISRDTAKTWVIDTTGLGGTVQDAAIDSNQFVYAITYKGLFRQHPDSNIWHAMTTLPTGVVPNKIYIDRLNRMYLAAHLNGTPTLYRSLDGGANWLQHLSGMGNAIIFGFGDDAYGNVYAITATNAVTGGGNHIFRSNGGSWVPIDIPLIAGNNDSLYVKNIFTGIGGDSVLIATSAYGVFSSTDQGVTWSESNAGIPADQVFGLVRLPSNRFVASTSLGIFGKNSGDTLWQKTFPQSGYLGSQPLFRDNNGALYTLGPLVAAASINKNYPRLVMKSTDGGSSWAPDTLGISAVGANEAFSFFVDETGTQHLASYGPGGAPSTIFVKLPGAHWEGDSAGYLPNHNIPQAFGSDGKGSLWLSLSAQGVPNLWRRATSGGTWAPDTLGLQSAIVNSFAAAKNGTFYAGAYDGVYRRSSGIWSKLPPPAGLNTTTSAFSISIDSSGILIAGFQHFDANYNSIGDGVFATTNDGATWTNLGSIDTVTFRQFVSYGDTTYGLSYADGVFIFTTGSADVPSAVVPESASLHIYPNPASGNVTIVAADAQTSKIEIFDLLGKLQTSFTGTSTMKWDGRTSEGADVANGVYIVRVSGLNAAGHPFRASKQVVVQR